jgi:FRG domain-containing protein
MAEPHLYKCATWKAVAKALKDAPGRLRSAPGEALWFRGMPSPDFELLPTLFWRLKGRETPEIDNIESDLFFEFQARARELHERGLSDWDYLFFMRHHGVPTRILDWTDSFGVAVFFALEAAALGNRPHAPAIWALNPYRLNERKGAWELRDLVQPKYLGEVEEEFWEYGELLNSPDEWLHDEPVALYPQQISDRMRAQRGWFTMFGNSTKPLERQVPDVLARIDLVGHAVDEAREFLGMAGLRPYSIFPDLDHLSAELVADNFQGAAVDRTKAINGRLGPVRPTRARNRKT